MRHSAVGCVDISVLPVNFYVGISVDFDNSTTASHAIKVNCRLLRTADLACVFFFQIPAQYEGLSFNSIFRLQNRTDEIKAPFCKLK